MYTRVPKSRKAKDTRFRSLKDFIRNKFLHKQLTVSDCLRSETISNVDQNYNVRNQIIPRKI